MAQLAYSDDGRLLFTEEMKREYTILMPQMLPIHFAMLREAIIMEGYKVEMLETDHHGIIETGLRYVHNDTCYPALLVIGQLIDALESGKYDLDKTALIITQTGGGCRASNYIHLLRKALEKANLTHIPVISLNLSGLEKNPGFKFTIPLMLRMVFALVYGDMLTLLANQCRPYEREKGATDALVQVWEDRLLEQFRAFRGMRVRAFRRNLAAIVADFAKLPVRRTNKVRVGVVGEIYVKYAPLGNNNLEKFLLDEGCEPVVPGVLDFILFKVDNRLADVDLYGGGFAKKMIAGVLKKYILNRQRDLLDAVKACPDFRAPASFPEIKEGVHGMLGVGNKMGEGWLLTAEMMELASTGTPDIVCTQPFGCLPNHVVGKGMIRAIRERLPQANIVAIDYDPGATRINQENRIKLMLANARMRAEGAAFAPERVAAQAVAGSAVAGAGAAEVASASSSAGGIGGAVSEAVAGAVAGVQSQAQELGKEIASLGDGVETVALSGM